jgi:hypothetical protein
MAERLRAILPAGHQSWLTGQAPGAVARVLLKVFAKRTAGIRFQKRWRRWDGARIARPPGQQHA